MRLIDFGRALIFTCFCAGLSSYADAQDDTALPAYVRQVEDQVRVKGAVVKTEKELNTETDGGGDLTIYSKAGEPVKMILSIYLSNREAIETFYYYKGNIILCVNRSRYFRWDAEKEELDPANTSEQYEERYYFKNGLLACWLTIHDPRADESYKVPMPNPTQCLQDSSYYLKVAASKEKTVDVSKYVTGKP